MEGENFSQKISRVLNKEYFAIGKERIRSWEAIFLIGIISGFVCGVIWIESESIDFTVVEVAAVIRASEIIYTTSSPEILDPFPISKDR